MKPGTIFKLLADTNAKVNSGGSGVWEALFKTGETFKVFKQNSKSIVCSACDRFEFSAKFKGIYIPVNAEIEIISES